MTWSFATPKRCCFVCASISYIVPMVLWMMLSDTCVELALDSVWLARYEGYRVENRQIVGWKRTKLNNPFWIDRYNGHMQRMGRWEFFGYGLVLLAQVPTAAFLIAADEFERLRTSGPDENAAK